MDIVFIDFETTGLLRHGSNDWMVQPGVVQIGAIRIDGDGKETGRISQLVNPEMKIDDGAAKVHGISSEMVKDAPSLFEFLPAFSKFVLGSSAWGGYNSPFDKDVLWFQLLRYGAEKNFPWPPNDIDVMKLVSAHLGQVTGKSHDKWKLGNAYKEVFGKPLEGAHGAIEERSPHTRG